MNNAKAALNSIELIQISTIHAFLLKVLKKYSFESGVVAEVTMLDDSDDLARKKSFFDDWYRDHFDEIQKYNKDWIVKDQYGYERDCCREVFENMFCDIASVREKIMDEKADHSADLQNYATKYVNTWLKVLDNFDKNLQLYRPYNKDGITPTALPAHTAELCSAIETVVQKSKTTIIFSVDDALKISRALSLIYEVVSGKKESFYRGTESTVLVPYYPDYPDWELEWNFEEYYTEYYLPAEKANKVVAYVKQMQEAYQKQTDKETKVISNDDILFRAEKLLTAHEDILDKLRNSYDKIYIDEFQDTTDLQTRIVRLLSEKPGTSLEDNNLSPDKLLFVGDPKQSIYRFTGAEKALYDKTDRMMKDLPDTIAESVELETNFRSNSDIVSWVNLHFKDLIDGYSEMDSSRDVTDRSTLYGVFCYDQPAMTAPLRHDDEVVAVVDLVKKFVSGGNIEVINDKNEPEVRPIQYSDIMIICKNAFNLSKYVKRIYFDARGVKIRYITGNAGFNGSYYSTITGTGSYSLNSDGTYSPDVNGIYKCMYSGFVENGLNTTLEYIDLGVLDQLNIIGGVSTDLAGGDSAGLYRVFAYCPNLYIKHLPNSIRMISSYSFMNDESINIDSIPNKILVIGKYAFSGCTSLSNVNFKLDYDNISSNLIQEHNSTYTDLQRQWPLIDVSAFANCSNLCFTYISNDQIKYDTYLKMIATIGQSAFENCTNFKMAYNQDSNENIDSILYIGNSAFKGCINLGLRKFPTNIIHIGANAFALIGTIAASTIPRSIRYIGSGVFIGDILGQDGVNNLTIRFPNDLDENNRSIVNIEANALTGLQINSLTFQFDNTSTLEQEEFDNFIANYKTIEPWKTACTSGDTWAFGAKTLNNGTVNIRTLKSSTYIDV